MISRSIALFVGLSFGGGIVSAEEAAPLSREIYEVVEGKAEVAGDPDALQKGARESWKKACEVWKKEVRELNKENQVLVLDCGSVQCSPEGIQTLCRSTAQYKLKVKMQK